MQTLDLFSTNRPAKRLNPEEVDRILDRLILAHSVDPAQVPLHQPATEDSPELQLHRAILFDAVQCAVRHVNSPLRNQQLEGRAAMRWINSNDESYFLSFVPICQRFHIEPEWIRRLVRTEIRRESIPTHKHQVAEAA